MGKKLRNNAKSCKSKKVAKISTAIVLVLFYDVYVYTRTRTYVHRMSHKSHMVASWNKLISLLYLFIINFRVLPFI